MRLNRGEFWLHWVQKKCLHSSNRAHTNLMETCVFKYTSEVANQKTNHVGDIHTYAQSNVLEINIYFTCILAL
jgi:hypothetical protein